MKKSKVSIFVAPDNRGKTSYLVYLVKLYTSFKNTYNSIVCVTSLDEKMFWEKTLKNKKFLLTGLGKHTLGKDVNKFFIDDINHLSNLQIYHLKKDLESNIPNRVWCIASKINYELFDKIFVNYEVKIIRQHNFYLKWYQKIINKLL